MITANLKNHTNNFMPQGNLTELTAGDTTPSPVLAATSAPLMAQVNSNTHRYAFGTAGYLEVSAESRHGFVKHMLHHISMRMLGKLLKCKDTSWDALSAHAKVDVGYAVFQHFEAILTFAHMP